MSPSNERRSWLYATALLAVAILLGTRFLGNVHWDETQWVIVLAMTAIALAIQVQPPAVPWTHQKISPLVLTVITTGVLLGPAGALIVGLLGMIRPQQIAQCKWRALIMNTANVSLAGVGGAWVYHLWMPIGTAHLVSGLGFVSLMAAIVTATAVNVGLFAPYMGILHGSSAAAEFRSVAPSVGTMVLGAMVLSPVMLVVFRIFGNEGLILLVLPVVVLHMLLGRQEQRARLFRGAIDGLGSALAAKDRGTFEHSRRVGQYASAIGEHLHMSQAQVQLLYVNGLMHDVGKLGVEDEILLKRSRFTSDEYHRMKSHATLSEAITRPFWDKVAGFNAVSYHHERWDGQGYPHGLEHEAIPIQGRILAVADSFDAMTADRPYHQGIGTEEAYGELMRCAGTQFDPMVVRAFLETQGVAVSEDFEEQVRRQAACAQATGDLPGATITSPQWN